MVLIKGVQLLVDDSGKKRAVLIDLSEWGEIWEDFYDVLVSESRKHEPTVLEHCSSPRNVLEEARQFLAPASSHLYVEVPYERTDLRGYRDTNVYRRYMRFLTAAPPS